MPATAKKRAARAAKRRPATKPLVVAMLDVASPAAGVSEDRDSFHVAVHVTVHVL
jgi:hypothetical protein